MANIDIADPGASAAALKAALMAAVEPIETVEPITSNYVLASVIGAAIVNTGTGGTPGAATVTGTTGTGTKFQATVTIEAGGTIESVDSISVAGAYTVPPTDLTAEPVTGGGLTGATLALGMVFSPAIVGSASTSGLAFGEEGAAFLQSDNVSFGIRNGAVVATAPGSITLKATPGVGSTGAGQLETHSFGAAGGYFIYAAGGVNGNKTVLSSGVTTSYLSFNAWDGSGWIEGVSISTKTEDALGIAQSYHIGTDSGSGLVDRVVVNGDGDTEILNGVFRLAGALTVATLPATPALGMMAVVTDALAPVIGDTVGDGGAANAMVWWNGAAWTVTGV